MVVRTFKNEDPGLLNNYTKKYRETPLSNRVKMNQQDHQTCAYNATRKLQKKLR
jgi:hypothetical protein